MIKSLIIPLLLIIPAHLYSQNTDIELLRKINSSNELPSDNFWRFVSNSEIYVGLGIPVGTGTAGLMKNDNELLRSACVILAAEAVTSVISTTLKYSVKRERPFITYSGITKKAAAGSPSFPSGHTSNAFAAATSLSLEFPKWYVIVPSYAWAGSVGYSRMHLGVHYPSDVLAGAVIGSGCAWITHVVNKKLNSKSNKVR
jgi:membrane-associated phospholipid phosphatase